MRAAGPPGRRHLPNPFYQLADSLLHRGQLSFTDLRSLYLWRFSRWQLDALFAPPLRLARPERATVVLLSYRRVRNMQPIVRSLLKASFVERVVLSNNNPEVRIRDWVSLEDSRLTLLDQPEKTPPGARFELALAAPGDYFFSIDDDTFLYPAQLAQLFEALVARPEAPHGVGGENYLDLAARGAHPKARRQHGWSNDLRGFEGRVDVINGVYAFTRAHARRLADLASGLGLRLGSLANGEDVLLSLAGEGRPFVHDVGLVASCLSSNQRGVSTWRTRVDFFREREALYLAARRLARGEAPADPAAAPHELSSW